MNSASLLTCLPILFAGAAPVAPATEARVWFQNSTTKVFRDGPPGEAAGVRLTAAGNEVESFRIVVRAGDEPLRNVAVRISDLRTRDGVRIAPEGVALFRVAYVRLPNYDWPFPDALPPLRRGSDRAWELGDVPASRNQPVWVDISVPADAEPGLYRATVAVHAQGLSVADLPVELTVWNFALPATPRSRTAFGLYVQGIAEQHGVELGSAAHHSLVEKYAEMLVAHRAMPRDLIEPLESPECARNLDDPRVNAFLLPYSDDQTVLKKRAAYVREKGWMDKAYLYVMDEPIHKEHLDVLRERAAKIHAADPGLKIVVPYFRDPSFAVEGGMHGALTGLCDIWCPKVSFYREDFLPERQKLGEEVWWYVCWEPGAPYPNLLVDMAGIDHRILFWQQAHYNVQGFLYWTSTYWRCDVGTADPWTDMATVKDLSPTVYGDGSLLYPGAKVGFDGPVASIRLKLVREGLEDVEYLRLLEDREGRDAVRALTRQVVYGLDEYSRDVGKMLALREEAGRRLSEAPRRGAGRSVRPLTIDKPLVAHWTFDEESGQDPLDASGNGNTASDYHKGWLSRVEGVFGNAIVLARRHMLHVPGKPDFAGIERVTLSAWTRPNRFWKNGAIFRKEDGNNRVMFSFAENGTVLKLGLNVGGYVECCARTNPAQLLDGRWHHCAATFDGKDMRVYLDGEEIGSRERPGAVAAGGAAPGCIGSSTGRECFQGAMDDLRIYRDALTPGEIEKLHRNGQEATGQR